MKKILIALFAALALTGAAFAQNSSSESTKQIWDHGNNVSKMGYRNFKLLRVLDHKEAYVCIYEKSPLGVGSAVIPKKWFKEVPKKLEIRNQPGKIFPYMSIWYENDEFSKVVLTVPASRRDTLWGVLPTYVKLEGTDAETLELK